MAVYLQYNRFFLITNTLTKSNITLQMCLHTQTVLLQKWCSSLKCFKINPEREIRAHNLTSVHNYNKTVNSFTNGYSVRHFDLPCGSVNVFRCVYARANVILHLLAFLSATDNKFNLTLRLSQNWLKLSSISLVL